MPESEDVPFLVAATVAAEAAVTLGSTPEERVQLLDAAFCVGQWLADEGHPGRWDMVKPDSVLAGLVFLPEDEQEQFLLSLIGLLGTAAYNGNIPFRAARSQMKTITRIAKNDVTRALARSTAEGMRNLMVGPEESVPAQVC